MTISIGGDEEPVRCHKHIVAMVSDVIQVEAMEKEEIFLSNISKDTLTQLIDYCYTAMIGPFVSKEQVSFRCITLVHHFKALVLQEKTNVLFRSRQFAMESKS